MTAGRAAVVAQSPDVGGCVYVRRPAAQAVLRVGCVLERRPSLRGIVDAEGDPAWAHEVADLRVVRFHDQRSPVGKLRDGRPPPLGDLLQLAVAVELVAEQ